MSAKRETRILMLEDSPSDAELAERALRRADLVFTLKCASGREAFVQLLADFCPDIVLSDYKLSNFDGMAALKMGLRDYPDVPVIMIADVLTEVEAVELIHAGATDYVMKDHLARLGTAVQKVLLSKQEERARKEAEKALQESESKFHKLAAQAPLGIALLDESHFVYVNPRFAEMFGYTEDEVLKMNPIDIIEKESRPFVLEKIRNRLSGEIQRVDYTVKGVRKDGSGVDLEVHGSRMMLDGKPMVISTLLDITARKRDELALKKANRCLLTLSACNQALVRATSETQLLDSICRLIVEKGGYSMAWVGFAEQDAPKTVRPVAHYGHEEGYLTESNFSWADSGFGRGPTGAAVRTGTVQINKNFQTNRALAPWREAALKRGYQSSIALPLNSFAGLLGVLTIYASESQAFNEEEVVLLQELADNLGFGMEALRTRAERDLRVKEHLRHEEILRQSLEDSIKAIADTVEMRDPYTSGHQSFVALLASAIATEMGLPKETIHGIGLAASIHDFGKIKIPAEILSKPGKLSDAEMMLVRTHPQSAYDILKGIKFPWPLATMILQHHEKMDGSGYPQGLKGDQILLESRIVTVADVVESMALHRPYRDALGVNVALDEIKSGRGIIYDAAVVDACLKLFHEGFSLEGGMTTGAA